MPPSHRLFLLLITILGITSIASCTKEFKPENTASVLKYYPFGENVYPRILSNFNQGNFTGIVNGNVLTQRSSDLLKNNWDLPQNGWPMALIPCKDKSSIVVNNDPFTDQSLNICRISENGEYLYNSINIEFFPEYPNYKEYMISCTGDANNGIYMVVGLLEYGKSADNILSKDIYILHFNAQNIVDRKFPLHDFFSKIVCDDNGNLYGLYHSKNTWWSSGTGAEDTVVLAAFDETALKANTFKAKWTVAKSHVEYYTNFYFERYSLLSINSNTVYFALPKAKWLDYVYGFDLYAINKNSGDITHTLSHTAPHQANTYSEGALYTIFSNNNGCYVSYKIGASTKLIHMNSAGQNDMNMDLKSKSNRTDILSIHQLEKSIGVFGYSTFGKSLSGKPFLYEIQE